MGIDFCWTYTPKRGIASSQAAVCAQLHPALCDPLNTKPTSWFFTPEPSANCFPNWLNYQLPTGNCIRVPGTLLPWQSSLFCLNFSHSEAYVGFPGGSDGKESTCSEGDLSSIPGLGKPPGEGNSYPIFWPGEFHGQRSLESYSPWGWKEWRTEQPSHTNVYICKYRGRDISLHF